ncbi:MAG: thiolase family protein [Bacillota bacterium]
MSNRDDVVVVAAVRTPFGRFGGAMKDVSSLELGVKAVEEVLKKAGCAKEMVDELYFGTCVLPENALETNVLGRQAVLKAGLPPETVSLTIDRACCSSMTALHLGYRSIKSGEVDVVIAVGAENMSRAPFLAPEVRWGQRLGPAQLIDPLYALGYADWSPVAVDAGEVALKYGVDREEQDRWALRSQKSYARALEEAKFADEIFPVEVSSGKKVFTVEQDEQPRPDVTLEQLSKLPTVYGSPTVTAGNAPGMNTGAAALLIMSRKKAEELGSEILGAVRSTGSVALEPHLIAAVPAPAIEKALERSNGINLDQLSLIEINEAFAAMPLVSSKILAAGGWQEISSLENIFEKVDHEKLEKLREKINVNGGAVAIGHPVGASGARIIMTLLLELRRRGGGYGAAAICGGLAQGDAVLVEV